MKPKTKASLILVRLLLCLLILANMTLIFCLSSENGEKSGATSKRVTTAVARVLVKDFDTLPKEEQLLHVDRLHGPMRSCAHMGEFGCLGALVLLLLLTWGGRPFPRYLSAVGFTFLYACTDELHQKLVSGRASQISDLLIDTLGALLAGACVLLLYRLVTRKKKERKHPLKTTRYFLNTDRRDLRLRIAVASDLHGSHQKEVLQILQTEKPDLILIPGDLMEDNDLILPTSSGYDFLRECAKLAPTYYSYGNHEIGCYHKGKPWLKPTPVTLPDEVRGYVEETGVILLDDQCVSQGDLCLCGLRSGLNGKINKPNEEALKSFDAQKGFRILLCHHPEYYMPYVRKTGIELTVCGHAHGGQWRIFGRGVFAPGQGIFPKYTSGVLENRCAISRGIGNHTHYPRIFNAPEVLMLYYGYTPEQIGK